MIFIDKDRCITISTDNEQLATLGGGCFWCLEAVFQDIQGIQNHLSLIWWSFLSHVVPTDTWSQPQTCFESLPQTQGRIGQTIPDLYRINITWSSEDHTTISRDTGEGKSKRRTTNGSSYLNQIYYGGSELDVGWTDDFHAIIVDCYTSSFPYVGYVINTAPQIAPQWAPYTFYI